MSKIMLALAAIAAAVLVDARPGRAYVGEGPWCAYSATGHDYYRSRCDLPNYEACRAEIMATAGTWCTENPYYRGPAERPARIKRQKVR